jgi:lipid-A-disaccharide synthase-like uncharacterized protein
MAFDFPSSPTTGQTYLVTGGPTYVYNGTAWVVLTPGNQFNRTVFTATAGQTTFTMNYVVGAIDVYRNGVKLAPADFTATNGTSIVLANGCTVGDTVEVISYAMITYSDAVKRTGDTMTGFLTVASSTSHSGLANNAALIQASQVAGSDAGVLLGSTNGNTPYIAASNLNGGSGSATPLLFYTGATERMRIDTAGRITAPYQPAFLASSTGATHTTTTGSVLDFNTLQLDRTASFNTSTYRFTAPVSGVYYFYFQVYEQNTTTNKSVCFRKNGSQFSVYDVAVSYQGPVNVGDHTINASIVMNLSANDYVDIAVRTAGSNLQWYGGHSWFMGYLIG